MGGFSYDMGGFSYDMGGFSYDMNPLGHAGLNHFVVECAKHSAENISRS